MTKHRRPVASVACEFVGSSVELKICRVLNQAIKRTATTKAFRFTWNPRPQGRYLMFTGHVIFSKYVLVRNTLTPY